MASLEGMNVTWEHPRWMHLQLLQRVYAMHAISITSALPSVLMVRKAEFLTPQVLNRMADLVAQDAMLGVGMVLKHTSVGIDFIHASSYIHQQMEAYQQSTIVSSIISAMNGSFGRTSVNVKTQERMPWISPLTALYWFFQAEPVARLKLFFNAVADSNTIEEIAQAIDKIRHEGNFSAFEQIPL